MQKTKFLIIGQGLAGTLLSYSLYEKGIPHLVISSNKLPSASMVAAGMYNPIVFKRLTKSWMIDTLLPVMTKTYKDIETLTNSKILYDKPIAKLIQPEEKEWWLNRIDRQNLEDYFGGFHPNTFINNIKSEFEIALIKNSGYVDLRKLISSYANILNAKQNLITDEFDYEQIELNASGIKYKNIEAEKIIFCEGSSAINNPFFPKDVFYLSRGDVLTCEIEDLDSKYIINKDIFILPKDNNKFVIGSTYQHNNLNTAPQNEDKDSLLEKAQRIINSKINVIDHKVGIRPTVKDRRPILGFHPEYKQLAFFNGLGTKGVMLAPYFSELMADYLIDINSELSKEFSIDRFFKSE